MFENTEMDERKKENTRQHSTHGKGPPICSLLLNSKHSIECCLCHRDTIMRAYTHHLHTDRQGTEWALVVNRNEYNCSFKEGYVRYISIGIIKASTSLLCSDEKENWTNENRVTCMCSALRGAKVWNGWRSDAELENLFELKFVVVDFCFVVSLARFLSVSLFLLLNEKCSIIVRQRTTNKQCRYNCLVFPLFFFGSLNWFVFVCINTNIKFALCFWTIDSRFVNWMKALDNFFFIVLPLRAEFSCWI